MADSLENIVEKGSQLEAATPEESELEKKVKKDKFSFPRLGIDLAKISPLAYAVYIVVQGTYTPLLTISGFILGNLMESYVKFKRALKSTADKAKVKFTDFFTYKLLKRDVTTATVTGGLDYWFWTLPNLVPNLTLEGKIARTLFAMPVLAIAYLFPYNQYLYFRDNVGLGGTLKSLFTGKIFHHLREAQKYSKSQIKPQLKSLVPLYGNYFLGLNYLTNIYHRIGVSMFNNFYFRLKVIAGRHDKKPKKDKLPLGERLREVPKRIDDFFKHPDYQPIYQPAYARA